MISDKEARQYILQQLYDEGFRYLARDRDTELGAHREKPYKDTNTFTWDNFSGFMVIIPLPCFKDIKWVDEEPLDIAKELGIIDWTKVPKDTKVLVWDGEGTVKNKRYFSHYEESATNFPFRVYCDGATSWSNTDEPVGYHCCELFKDDDDEEEEQDHD